MINILERLDAGEECIVHELAYGQSLMQDWPKMVGDHYDPIVAELVENKIPEQMRDEYVTSAENMGMDPQNDEVRFTYLYSTAMSFKQPARPLVLYKYLFEHQIEPLVFQDDRLYYILMGHLGLMVVFRGRPQVSIVELKNVIDLLRELL